MPSPGGDRVLARPNGLAGWALPAIAVDLPFDRWDAEALAAAEAAVGAPVRPLEPLPADAWAVATEGRVGAAGTTWIGADDADRLGSDAAVARAWFGRARDADGG